MSISSFSPPISRLPGVFLGMRSISRPILFLLLTLIPALSASAQTALTLWDGEDAVVGSTLSVGARLHAGLVGVVPGEVYVLEVLDESSTVIASATTITDAAGDAEPVFLFSNVVGCDPGADVDPTELRFDTWAAAESGLVGREIDVVARRVSTGIDVATASLDFDVTLAVPRFAAVDAAGCPRSRLPANDPVYLAGYHLPAASTVRIFVVPKQASWRVGAPLRDVRTAYSSAPQVIVLDPAETSFVELAWASGDPGDYDLVLRFATRDDPYLGSDDLLVNYAIGWGNGTGPGLSLPSCWNTDDGEDCSDGGDGGGGSGGEGTDQEG